MLSQVITLVGVRSAESGVMSRIKSSWRVELVRLAELRLEERAVTFVRSRASPVSRGRGLWLRLPPLEGVRVPPRLIPGELLADSSSAR